jgi:hypothetical protein
MPTNSQIASPLADIVPIITAQLVVKTGVPTHSVKVVARGSDYVAKFQGDRDLLLRFSGAQPQAGFTHGAGRVATILDRVLQVTCRVRLNTDPSDDDTRIWVDPTWGLLVLEEAVIDALWGFWPTDTSQNVLTPCVLEWVPSQEAAKQLVPPPPLDWIESHLHFLVTYQANLPSGTLWPQPNT